MAPQPHSPRTQSPLTRVKHSLTAPNAPPGGLIPAHAGKTHLRPPKPDRRRAHPRSRGENAQCVDDVGVFTGSSPFTRGKPFCGLSVRACARLIPAHAGKTARSLGVLGRRGAHPRSRGENKPSFSAMLSAVGSSPLTRGKRLRPVPRTPLPGLIPAHAEKTSCRSPGWPESAAHPRSRGENGTASRPRYRARGSSPLTRGKREDSLAPAALGRLIPAHAGKTMPHPASWRQTQAHPRSRGENTAIPPVPLPFTGSSPLTRGKPRSQGCSRRWCGLIPAHAGKTAFGAADPKIDGAHPRSRGENWKYLAVGFALCGSSPLTRGKQPYRHPR